MSGEAPDWATKEAEEIFQMVVDLTEGLYDQTPGAPSVEAKIALTLAVVDQRAYRRGIEEAAKVAKSFGDTWSNSRDVEVAVQEAAVDEKVEEIATAIRQLLEVKG
jgi:hypothetical protein